MATKPITSADTRVYLDKAISRLKELLQKAGSKRKTDKYKCATTTLQMLERRASAMRDLILYGADNLVSDVYMQQATIDPVLAYWGDILDKGGDE